MVAERSDSADRCKLGSSLNSQLTINTTCVVKNKKAKFWSDSKLLFFDRRVYMLASYACMSYIMLNTNQFTRSYIDDAWATGYLLCTPVSVISYFLDTILHCKRNSLELRCLTVYTKMSLLTAVNEAPTDLVLGNFIELTVKPLWLES